MRENINSHPACKRELSQSACDICSYCNNQQSDSTHREKWNGEFGGDSSKFANLS